MEDHQRKLVSQQIPHLRQNVLLAYAVPNTPAAYTSHPDTLAAFIWLATALAVTLPYRQWWSFPIAVFNAMMVVGDIDELLFATDAAYALLTASH